ncbi:nitrate reductase, alpha subunit [Deferribacter desulfuricans SSM1]|uniref:nitrate reductase (quinone) n=1 Tax=Deferribacter desulfuricans (strain DSM 14783 / JCM 11476 / NBRC 101012 / SSM1) TaxID=639282 RepID=D3P9Z7_DEFDS|nr:nitrate reductase subunit alpha [Deferribacter desulfuricans]BAI81537.1 nitrate reductase, alpha subunit [Deferribacter desulfuricans SSM1]
MSIKITKNSWFEILKSSEERKWEELYRSRWEHDKVVRSTHGVNCTGSCSWNVFVKDGLVVGEVQATDYPAIGGDIPMTEPRGCARGASFSWYLYSPIRVKYPYIRGKLLDLWLDAKKKYDDPVDAWASIVEDTEKRNSYMVKRGKGGFRRIDYESALELIAASNIYTIKKYGPDRIIGFSPIPAMSQISYAAGSRYLNLIGGVVMSFYDWYCDLPLASPQVWGEQTDVCESADWFNSSYTVLMGSNVNVTRTPDAHYLYESKMKGGKIVVMSPDYSSVTKGADLWIKINKGQDGAFWLAVNHVILNEFYNKSITGYFDDYVRKYTDLPFLVYLDENNDSYEMGRMVRASDFENTEREENAEWKYAVIDLESKNVVFPYGSIGFRWAQDEKNKFKWRLINKCGISDKEIVPTLSILEVSDRTIGVKFYEYHNDKVVENVRNIPVFEIETKEGKKFVTTVFDLLNGMLGVDRGLGGDYPSSYYDDKIYTPKWQEKYTGVNADTVIKVAREFAENAAKTCGKSMIIIGAGINHWYHQDLMYRSAIMALLLTGSVGVNGGGLAHYVGQEKVAMLSSWATIAMAGDWLKPPRLQNTPSFWYIHSDQWRYEDKVFDYFKVNDENKFKEKHTADFIAKAVRLGWLPFYPSFSENPLNLAKLNNPQANVVNKLKKGELKFSVEEPDNPVNFPRVWFIWRANAIASSAKGHEYFMRHVLGTSDNLTAEEKAVSLKDVNNQIEAPKGKIDLIVDINFRMDTSALYSDIILPAATWYEKDDLNTTDMHSFVHPLRKVVAPLWESKSDWNIFKDLAKKFSALAEKHFPKSVKDLVVATLLHDTPEEIMQRDVKDWKYGETEPIPGKTIPKLAVIERDYKKIYHKFISLGPNAAKSIGAHGVSWDSSEEYEELKIKNGAIRLADEEFPSLEEPINVANAILHLAPETNGKVAVKGFKSLSKFTGINFDTLVKGNEKVKMDFDDITIQPRRLNTSPIWSGIIDEGRPYAPYTINTEFGLPWRTLTGRQHFYLDHEFYKYAGEMLPVYKPNLPENVLNELIKTQDGLVLNYHTPHGKWHIHSTYYDNLRMLSLSRGGQVIWLNNVDAEKYGIKDNDWVEVYNKNGVVICKTVVSSRMPSGVCYIYHATERTINVPISEKTNNRGGNHNSLTRVRLKPLAMVGGCGQFSYYFNYWGPVGVNRDTYVVVKKLNKVRF